MPYVLTIDQIASRRRMDAVPGAMRSLAAAFPDAPISRTVGDEFQMLFDRSVSAVDAILALMRNRTWHVGVGIGTIDEPTSRDLREGRGPAFLAARRAVEEAKDRADHLRVIASSPAESEGHDAEVLLSLILALRSRRSPSGWAAADLADGGLTQTEIADHLGVSRQAVNQRLHAAQWRLDVDARPVAARLLERAERRVNGSGNAT